MFLEKAKETKELYEIKSRRLQLQILICFIFLKNHGFIEEGNPPEKFVMAKKKLNGIHVDDPGNLEDSPRLVLINEECLYLIVNDGEELIKNIKQKTKSDVLQ